MAEKFAYLEQCRDLHSDIERAGINLDIKEPSGWGSNTIYRSIGSSTLNSGEVVYVGLKQPRSRPAGLNRLLNELCSISIITERCPELMPLVPQFMGWTEWRSEECNIAEDATRGGQTQVYSSKTSKQTRSILTTGFAEFGKLYDVFDDYELDRTTSFKVDGAERLLDFTPSPLLDYNDILKSANPGVKFTHFLHVAEKLKFTLPDQR